MTGSKPHLLMALVLSCGTGLGCIDPSVDAPGTLEFCTPDRNAFQTNALPALNRACGTCHGPSPEHGASESFVDYDTLITGEIGFRPVDHILERLAQGDMPPAPVPAPHGPQGRT